MKITAVEIIPLVRQLEEAFTGGTYRIVNRYTLVTRIHTDSGYPQRALGAGRIGGYPAAHALAPDATASLNRL